MMMIPARLMMLMVGLFCFFVSFSFAQDRPRSEIGFRNDNDAYLMIKQDQYYTNGIQFFFRKAVDSTRLSSGLHNKIWTVSLGQKIFNAYKGDIRSIREIDRPITGYLFAKAQMKWFKENEELFSLGAEFATIGPSALGEKVQRRFHDTFGFYEIRGWDYQLKNAFGLDLNATYDRLLIRSKGKGFDVVLHGSASLGLNNSFLMAGTSFRIGRLNALFESTFSGSRLQAKSKQPANEIFLFYTPQLRWTGYNSTVQGGMLVHDKGPVTFEIEPFVFSNILGLQYAGKKIGLNYSYIFNTREVKSSAGFQQYGSLSVNYFF